MSTEFEKIEEFWSAARTRIQNNFQSLSRIGDWYLIFHFSQVGAVESVLTDV